MMKRLIFAGAALLALAGTASAAGLQFGERGFPGTPAPHAVTPRLSCGQVQTLVARNNHAVLSFGQTSLWAGYGTDRVVKDHRFCLQGEDTTPIWVPTRDNAQCFAGYTCAEGGERGSRRGGR